VRAGHELLYRDMVIVPISSRPVHKVVNPRLRNVRMPHHQNDKFSLVWIA
jgi:hypothetical protein